MRSVQVHYHQGVSDALLAEVVRPLLRVCAEHDPRAFFVPHWRRGEHVRLEFAAGEAALSGSVLPAARSLVSAFAARSPSRCAVEAPEAVRAHRRLAELESEAGPLVPWYPDNTVVVEHHHSRAAVLGGEAAAGLIADGYAATNELVLDARAATPSRSARLTLALDLMVATADRLCDLDLRHAHLCFRSHAEGFLASFREARGLRERWDAAYERAGAGVAGRVRAQAGNDPPELVARWLAAAAPLRERARSLVASGELRLDAAAPADRPPIAELSEYHRVFSATAVYREQIAGQVWFDAYRVLLNLLYLNLTRMGITPVERFMLCHFATRAVADVHGEPTPGRAR